MIFDKDVRAQQVHCQDLLREAEQDRRTYGEWLQVQQRKQRTWSLELPRLEAVRTSLVLVIGAVLLALLAAVMLLARP